MKLGFIIMLNSMMINKYLNRGVELQECNSIKKILFSIMETSSVLDISYYHEIMIIRKQVLREQYDMIIWPGR